MNPEFVTREIVRSKKTTMMTMTMTPPPPQPPPPPPWTLFKPLSFGEVITFNNR